MNNKYSYSVIKNQVSQINTGDLVEHYHIDYHDGPLSGIIRWKGERYYAHCIDEIDEVRPEPDCEICDGTGQEYNSRPWTPAYDCPECMVSERVFGLFKLPQDQLDEQDFWHNLYLDFVLNKKRENRSDKVNDFLFKFCYARRKKCHKAIDTDYLEPVGYFINWASIDEDYSISSWKFR